LDSGVSLRNHHERMKFRIVLEFDADTQAFSAVCPDLPGCASAGDTEEEAKQNIKEAIELSSHPRTSSFRAMRSWMRSRLGDRAFSCRIEPQRS
jgi:hypothetical protein